MDSNEHLAAILEDRMYLDQEDIHPKSPTATHLKRTNPFTSTSSDSDSDSLYEHEIAPDGFCVECHDHPAVLSCDDCQEEFCQVCFKAQHRKSKRRRLHTVHMLESAKAVENDDSESRIVSKANGSIVPDVAPFASPNSSSISSKKPVKPVIGFNVRRDSNPSSPKAQFAINKEQVDENASANVKSANSDDDLDDELEAIITRPQSALSDKGSIGNGNDSIRSPSFKPRPGALSTSVMLSRDQNTSLPNGTSPTTANGDSTSFGTWITERAKYIPIRLSLTDRKLLRLLEAALSVSEYTDKIDIFSRTPKATRIVRQVKELCSILCGLVISMDYNKGQKLFQDKNFRDVAKFYQTVFEVGRRHKVMNPEKMRSTFGKLIYMLQDSADSQVADILGFSCIKPLKTVHGYLSNHGCLEMLQDPLVEIATREIVATAGKARREIQKEINEKERAINTLVSRWSVKGDADEDTLRQCLYSIGDNHSFLRSHQDPCDKLIKYLTTHFDPNTPEREFSLSIQSGHSGARLSHSHNRQYSYVYQSLQLWREINHEMFKLYMMTEKDLLSDHIGYRLKDTGQGLQRVQACPNVAKEMRTILNRVQSKLGFWVGSAVVHLGDDNVPNALMFIDKYTQVSRILSPIVTCLEALPNMYRTNAAMETYLNTTFGSLENTIKRILSDFFKHAFDGSGADNFNSAGSCIDGRLTSAWNWCSTIEKKEYFPVFLLTGFVGFDGGGFD